MEEVHMLQMEDVVKILNEKAENGVWPRKPPRSRIPIKTIINLLKNLVIKLIFYLLAGWNTDGCVWAALEWEHSSREELM